MDKHRHKLFRWGVWGRSRGFFGRSSRKRAGSTTNRVTFLIILEVILATWNSDYFGPFWQYYYELTRTLTNFDISFSLNDPRRQGIGICTSNQMGCLQDNSFRTFMLYIHYRFNHVAYLHASSSRKVEHWFIKTMSNLCIGTCLLEPNVATPLYVLVSISILVYFFERVLCFSSSHLNFNPI